MLLIRGTVLMLVCCSFSFFEVVKGVRKGKLHFTWRECEDVLFSDPFFSGAPVRVFASLNHGIESSQVHDSAFLWVEDVTTSGFRACLVKGGLGYVGDSTIDWFAFQGSQSGVEHGQTNFTLFTTGTKCNRVTFPQAFSSVPKVHVTVKHGIQHRKNDAMNVWIESISRSQFEVCLRESRTFDGGHSNLMVTWMAYENFPSSWKAKESSKVLFAQNEIPAAENNYAFCKRVSFTNPFFTPPVVITTAINDAKYSRACAVKGPLSSWLEEVTKTHFRVCVNDYAGYGDQRSNVAVDYLVLEVEPLVSASSSCDGLFVRSSRSGIIFSNKNGQYINNMNCHWTLSSNANLELVFFRFATESGYDHVSVYDGGSTSSLRIGHFSGSSLPAAITSSHNKLYVSFRSDGSNTGSGFAAGYRVVDTIRLVNGTTPLAGRVEFFNNNQWGTICDDTWDLNDANVVCRQLGFPPASQAFDGAHHGQGSGPIWIDHVGCSGSESDIFNCKNTHYGNGHCRHFEDAGVECSSTIPTKTGLSRWEIQTDRLKGDWRRK